jgi:hypothetical protein
MFAGEIIFLRRDLPIMGNGIVFMFAGDLVFFNEPSICGKWH